MKSILYVGATLMIGASIYGFVDYKQAHQKEEFKSMYAEEKTIIPADVNDVKTTEPAIKKEIFLKSRKSSTKKKIVKEEEFIPGIKPIPADQKLKSGNKEFTLTDEVTVIPAKENIEVKAKKKRKINSKLFSRAPLREDIDDEAIAPVKKDSKKMTTKEQ